MDVNQWIINYILYRRHSCYTLWVFEGNLSQTHFPTSWLRAQSGKLQFDGCVRLESCRGQTLVNERYTDQADLGHPQQNQTFFTGGLRPSDPYMISHGRWNFNANYINLWQLRHLRQLCHRHHLQAPCAAVECPAGRSWENNARVCCWHVFCNFEHCWSIFDQNRT